MQALFIAWYNFGRKHEALKKQTPAMASKLTDHVWTIKELIQKGGGSMKISVMIAIAVAVLVSLGVSMWLIFWTPRNDDKE